MATDSWRADFGDADLFWPAPKVQPVATIGNVTIYPAWLGTTYASHDPREYYDDLGSDDWA